MARWPLVVLRSVQQREGVASNRSSFPRPSLVFVREAHGTQATSSSSDGFSVAKLPPVKTAASTPPSALPFVAAFFQFCEHAKHDLRSLSSAVVEVTRRAFSVPQLPAQPVSSPSSSPSSVSAGTVTETPSASVVCPVLGTQIEFLSLLEISDVCRELLKSSTRPPARVLDALCNVVLARLEAGQFDAETVSSLLEVHVFNERYLSVELLSVVAKAVTSNSAHVDVTCALRILTALGALRRRDDSLLQCLTVILEPQLGQLPPDALPQVLWACSQLGYHHKHLVDAVVAKMLWDVQKLCAKSLSQAVVALAALRHQDAMTDVLLDAVAELSTKRLSGFDSRDLVDLCWALAQLQHWGPLDQHFMDSVVHLMMSSHQMLDCQRTVNLLRSLAHFDGESDESLKLLESVGERVKRDIGAFSAQQLVDLLWSLCKQRYYDPQLYKLAVRAIVADIQSLQARHLADLLFSLAQVNCQPGAMLGLVELRALCLLHDMTARELCNTLWALGILDRLSPPLFMRIVDWLNKKRLEDMQLQHLERVYQAYLLVTLPSPTGAKVASIGVDAPPPPTVPRAEPRLPDWLEHHARRAWLERVFFGGGVHKTEQEVAAALRLLDINFELEQLIEDGNFKLDIAVYLPGKTKVGVEVDQYHRFTCNAPYLPLADTIFGRRFLQSRGWRVVNIEKHCWDEYDTLQEQAKYLKELLQQVAG